MTCTLHIHPHDDVPCALQIEVTSHCNLHCQMCPLTTGKTLSSQPRGHISRDVWHALLPIARQTEKVIIAGYGEPFVNRQCVALLQEMNRLDIRMGIATNGIPITPQLAGQLARLPHLIHINVSIESPDAALYREIRGDDIEHALRGVRHLMAAITDPQRVTVSSVLMHKTLDSLLAFPPLLAQLGVKRYCLQGMLDHNPDLRQEHLVHYQDVAGKLEQLKEICNQAGVELLFALPQRLDLELREPIKARVSYFQPTAAVPKAETRQCFIPWENPYIDKDGRVFPCCNASAETECVMGNLLEQEFAAIWEGELFQQFRNALLDGRTMPAVCRYCTTAPLGEHPFRQYAAAIQFDHSKLDNPEELRLVVQNTGLQPWTQTNPVQIGTTNPKDRVSIYFHPEWLSANRIATFTEEIVPPGSLATFHFPITLVPHGLPEVFQLLVPGIGWLPNTCFQIHTKQSPSIAVLSEQQSFPQMLRQTLRRLKRRVLKQPISSGERWLQVYSAAIRLEQSVLQGSPERCLIVENTGACYWTQETKLLIGTAEPHDRTSAYAHPGWLSATRIGTFQEAAVPPGGTATFRFQVNPAANAAAEVFQLVIEGKTWLPGTCFEL